MHAPCCAQSFARLRVNSMQWVEYVGKKPFLILACSFIRIGVLVWNSPNWTVWFFSFISGEQHFANWLRMLHIAHFEHVEYQLQAAKCRWLQWYITLQLHLVALAIRIKRTNKKYVRETATTVAAAAQQQEQWIFFSIMIMWDSFARTCAGWKSGQASERASERVLPISYISQHGNIWN